MRLKFIFVTGLALTMLYSLGAVCALPSAHGRVQKSETIDDSIEYDILEPHLGWIKKKTIVREGDCIYLLKERPGEAMPTAIEMSKRREDSFHVNPLFDTILSHYSCDISTIVRIWKMADSVYIRIGEMEAVVVRADTMLHRKHFSAAVWGKLNDTIPFSKIIDGLGEIKIQEYRFKDIESARASFRKLAFEPNVVMRGDTSWLHGDNGKFWITGVANDSEDMNTKIARVFPHDIYSLWFQEQMGVTWVNSDKSFYDKFNLYPKSDFQRPKRFSFVIYKKVE